VTAHGGFHVHADKSIRDVTETDMIFIPPFLPHVDPMPKSLDAFLSWAVARHRGGTPVAAMCTGTFVLAESGLLDGRLATTNWYFTRLFRQRYPRVRLQTDRMLTEEAGLICSGASTAVFHLGLFVIERFGSPQLAATCAKALLVDPNQSSQMPYMISDFSKGHQDRTIGRAQRWMEARFGEPITIEAVSRAVGLSPRHFKRRFKSATGETPITYLQRVRIEAAKDKLEHSRESVNDITWQIGYEDSSTFRRLFKKHTGLSPRAYRDKFSCQNGPMSA
jgi:transcriptional regulator GlxA family with amidase domain